MKIHLPQVFGDLIPRMSPNAQAFAVAWMDALPVARRELMVLDDRLVTAATLHAFYLDSRTPEEIAERANVSHASHYGRDWSTANERVRRAGYTLPDNYPEQGNSVESNARNPNGALAALESLLASEFHGPHLRGEGGYAGQTVYAVGNCGFDYVCLTCPPEES